jgi:hypothetical protein
MRPGSAEEFAEAIATSFRNAAFELSTTVLGAEDATIALRARRWPIPAAMAVIVQPSSIDKTGMKSLFNDALRLAMRELPKQLPWFFRDSGEGLTFVVVVSEAVDPQLKLWVRRRWFDPDGFPVIIDAATGEVVYRERLTFLGAIDLVVKRRLVRRVVVPAAAGVLRRQER